MSERQYEIYKFIVDYVARNLYAPTLAEIKAAVGVKSKSTVSLELCVLEQLGYIHVKIDTPRAIRLMGYTIVKTA